MLRSLAGIAAASLLVCLAPAATAAPIADGWAPAWAASPFPTLDKDVPNHTRVVENQTVRQYLRVGLGGQRLRIRLSNELGANPVRVGSVHVAVLDASGRARPGSDRVVSFSGLRDFTVRANSPMVSDPVDLPVRQLDRLAVSVFYPDKTEAAGHRPQVDLSGPGDHGGEPAMAGAQSTHAAALASEVDVQGGPMPERVIVAFGDSITEGAGSTANAFMGWPEQFNARLARDPRTARWVVINEGISGNRVLWTGAAQPAIGRFDRDVLDVPGVTDVVLLEGINDLGWGGHAESPVSADDLIAAYKQMILRAHARGVKIYAGTLLPYKGAVYFTEKGEADRQTVNRWIRTPGNFDGFIDFEAAMKDPAAPLTIRQDLQIKDNLHPNDAGYTVMAGAIDPRLFDRAAGRTNTGAPPGRARK